MIIKGVEVKTQHEIEKMKERIELEIAKEQSKYMDCYSGINHTGDLYRIIQLRAQYDILLEVMK